MHYMHYKDYIHHDFYVYSPVLLTQYLGHCWHTPCTELYILRISAWLLRKPPLPCHGGGNHLAGGGGGVGVPAHIYIYIYPSNKRRTTSILRNPTVTVSAVGSTVKPWLVTSTVREKNPKTSKNKSEMS